MTYLSFAYQSPKYPMFPALSLSDIVAIGRRKSAPWHRGNFRNFLPKEKLKATDTLPETNIAPENGWLEYCFPIGEAYFQGLC